MTCFASYLSRRNMGCVCRASRVHSVSSLMCRAASRTAASPTFFRMESGPNLGSPPISVAAMGLGQSRIDPRVASGPAANLRLRRRSHLRADRVPRRAAGWLIETLVVKLTVRWKFKLADRGEASTPTTLAGPGCLERTVRLRLRVDRSKSVCNVQSVGSWAKPLSYDA